MPWPIRNPIPSRPGYQRLPDDEMSALDGVEGQRPPRASLPPELWLEVTRHLKLRDVRALALSAPPFRRLAEHPAILKRFERRFEMVRQLGAPWPESDNAAVGGTMVLVLCAAMMATFLGFGYALDVHFTNYKRVPWGLAPRVRDCHGPTPPPDGNTTAPYTPAEGDSCIGRLAACYGALIFTGELTALSGLAFLLFPFADVGRVKESDRRPVSGWHSEIRKLYDRPVDRIMEAWSLADMRFEKNLASVAHVYGPSAQNRLFVLAQNDPSDWPRAQQLTLLQNTLDASASVTDAHAVTAQTNLQHLLHSCVDLTGIDWTDISLQKANVHVALQLVAAMLKDERMPDAERLVGWVESGWVDLIALYLMALTSEELNASSVWKEHASSFLAMRIETSVLQQQPLLCYVASLPEQAQILQLLIEAGACINAAGDTGTALHCAVRAGHTRNVQALRVLGADMLARDPDGHTVEDLAALRMGLR